MTTPGPHPDQDLADRLIEFDERLRTGSAGEPVPGAKVDAAGGDAQPIEELLDCVRKLEERWPRSARAIVEANQRAEDERGLQEQASDRFCQEQELFDDLRRNLASRPSAVRPLSLWQRVLRWFQ